MIETENLTRYSGDLTAVENLTQDLGYNLIVSIGALCVLFEFGIWLTPKTTCQ